MVKKAQAKRPYVTVEELRYIERHFPETDAARDAIEAVGAAVLRRSGLPKATIDALISRHQVNQPKG